MNKHFFNSFTSCIFSYCRTHGCGWHQESYTRTRNTSPSLMFSGQRGLIPLAKKKKIDIHTHSFLSVLVPGCALDRNSHCKRSNSLLFIFTADISSDTRRKWNLLSNLIMELLLILKMVLNFMLLREPKTSRCFNICYCCCC